MSVISCTEGKFAPCPSSIPFHLYRCVPIDDHTFCMDISVLWDVMQCSLVGVCVNILEDPLAFILRTRL